jgi:hypothetical protein
MYSRLLKSPDAQSFFLFGPRGLRAFLKDYPAAKAYFLYGGRRRTREVPIDCVPMETALRELPGILSGPTGPG